MKLDELIANIARHCLKKNCAARVAVEGVELKGQDGRVSITVKGVTVEVEPKKEAFE